LFSGGCPTEQIIVQNGFKQVHVLAAVTTPGVQMALQLVLGPVLTI
jgi:hypothetical protein